MTWRPAADKHAPYPSAKQLGALKKPGASGAAGIGAGVKARR